MTVHKLRIIFYHNNKPQWTVFLPRFRAHESADIELEHTAKGLLKSLDPEKEDFTKNVFRVRDDIFWRGIKERSRIGKEEEKKRDQNT